jgi:two-component system CheB/CheR fusion protein
MKSSNEEYQSVNEELQSANEELETSKEELTSINEELQTINGELGGKNEALNRVNNDLKNLLDSTQIATLFLDNHLRIKNFTPAMSEIFPIRDSDRGRPITEIVTRLRYDDLRDDVKKVLRSLSVVEHEVTVARDSATFLMRIRPYRTIEDKIDGVVVTFVDITARKRLEEERARLAAIVHASQDAIVGTSRDGVITSWNPGAETLFGASAQEMIGASIDAVAFEGKTGEMRTLIEKVRRGERIEQYEIEWQIKDSRMHSIALNISPVRGEAGQVIGTAIIARDISERRRADQLHVLMLDELNHRVKNTLATVQAIAAQSLQGTDVDVRRREDFEARIVALARTHNLLTRDSWEGVSLRELLLQELEPYQTEDEDRIRVQGAELRLTPKAAVALAMAFHELATNAAKYGAFSVPSGKVRVTWEIQTMSPERFRLTWVERDGPKIRQPIRKGFGAKLIERGLSLELDGQVRLDFEPAGLICTIEMPVPTDKGAIDVT